MTDTPPPSSPPSSAPDLPPDPGWRASLQAIWHDLPGLLHDRVELLALELQRARQVLGQIMVLLVVAAILAVTAWLALWVGVAVGLVELGLHWAAALSLMLALHAGAAWLAIARIRRLLPLLSLPATRRHLGAGPAAHPATAAAAVS